MQVSTVVSRVRCGVSIPYYGVSNSTCDSAQEIQSRLGGGVGEC